VPPFDSCLLFFHLTATVNLATIEKQQPQSKALQDTTATLHASASCRSAPFPQAVDKRQVLPDASAGSQHDAQALHLLTRCPHALLLLRVDRGISATTCNPSEAELVIAASPKTKAALQFLLEMNAGQQQISSMSPLLAAIVALLLLGCRHQLRHFP